MANTKDEIIKKLRQARYRHGLSQQRLADILRTERGIDSATQTRISQIERGLFSEGDVTSPVLRGIVEYFETLGNIGGDAETLPESRLEKTLGPCPAEEAVQPNNGKLSAQSDEWEKAGEQALLHNAPSLHVTIKRLVRSYREKLLLDETELGINATLEGNLQTLVLPQDIVSLESGATDYRIIGAVGAYFERHGLNVSLFRELVPPKYWPGQPATEDTTANCKALNHKRTNYNGRIEGESWKN